MEKLVVKSSLFTRPNYSFSEAAETQIHNIFDHINDYVLDFEQKLEHDRLTLKDLMIPFLCSLFIFWILLLTGIV